jgi:hypothetical protein
MERSVRRVVAMLAKKILMVEKYFRIEYLLSDDCLENTVSL